MTDTHDGRPAVAYERRQESDPVVWWLTFGIVFLIVVALVGVLYAILGGYLTPKTPRTLVESQLVLLRNTAKTYPTQGNARQAYILALEQSGQRSAATSEFKTALKQVKGLEQTPVYVAGLTLLFDAKDYKGTLQLAKEALAADDAARKAIITSAAQNDAVVTNAQFNNSARIAVLLTSARASGALGDWQTAVNTLSDALKLDPEGADLLTYRGSAYQHLGEKDKAIADYKAALAFMPDDAAAQQGLKALQGQ